MPTVKCRNTRNEKNSVIKCDRFLIQLPQCVIDNLKSNPGEKILLRCPTCPSFVRWVEIYYDSETGLTWGTVKKPEQFEPELNFDHVIHCEEVSIK